MKYVVRRCRVTDPGEWLYRKGGKYVEPEKKCADTYSEKKARETALRRVESKQYTYESIPAKGIDFSKLKASMDRSLKYRDWAKLLAPEILSALDAHQKPKYVRVLVTGGRDYADEAMVNAVLSEVRKYCDIALLIEGGAKGADRLCSNYAYKEGIISVRCTANWNRDGKAAGALRNKDMLHIGPHFCIAFPGGRGTADAVEQCQREGVPVIRVGPMPSETTEETP